MDCEGFRRIFPYFVEQLTQGQALDADLEDDWSEHLNDCKDCYTWFCCEQLKIRGYNPDNFPCPHVGFHATHECDTHDGAFDCPHQVIVNIDGDWGIPIKDESQSMIPIDNCPWCGVDLPSGWPQRESDKRTEVERDDGVGGARVLN